MLWIGITGPMGGGKSTVAFLLRQMRFEVVDADQIARQVLSPGSEGEAEVLRTFGQEFRDVDGNLDRRALGRLVFADKKKLAQLENIIHPRVRVTVGDIRQRLKAAGHRVTFYDVPLLFEKKMSAEFDYVWMVTADQAIRYQRLKTRSQLTDDEIKDRESHHLPVLLKEASASVVLFNNGSREELQRQLVAALAKHKILLPTST